MNIEKDESVCNKIGYNTDGAIDQLLYGHYPNLNQKEKLVYEKVLSTVLYCDYNCYDSILSYTLTNPKKLFANEQEVESTINDLVEKRILKPKINFYHAKPPEGVPYCRSTVTNFVICEKMLLKPRNVLELSNMNVAKEAGEIMSYVYEATVKESFSSTIPTECMQECQLYKFR